jgi:elongation factor Ts
MAAITAALVKELRERTGLGMMDCKAALGECDGDLERAELELRKRSSAKAAKKAARIAAEGRLGLAVGAGGAALVEVNSETDFAAKNEKFIAFVRRVAEAALAAGSGDVEQLLAGELGAERERLVQEIGENLAVRRAVVLTCGSGERVGTYLHGDAKKGAVVLLAGGDDEVARNVAMHVTAAAPIVLKPEEVPANLVAAEREVAAAQAAESGKPADIVAKMVEGRVRKYLAEVSLLEQGFVKDEKQKVGALLAAAKARCLRFSRLEVGEGIERRSSDFAAEVAAQLRG